MPLWGPKRDPLRVFSFSSLVALVRPPGLIARTDYHRSMAIYNREGYSPSRAAGTSLDSAAALFRSLSDVNRLAILRRLAEGEARVADLVSELGLAQSTVSAHVACLRDCGLVDGRPQGRQVFYSLVRAELLDLLAAAEIVLAVTGNSVALCPHYGADATTPRISEREEE